MTTVFDVMLQALRELDALVEGVATGGSTSTVADAALAALGYQDDHFNEGRAFIVKTTDGLAPQGESRRVSDFAGGTGTISVPTNFSAAVGAGDVYAVGTKRYPAGQILGKVNEALAHIGDVPTVDSSLTTQANDPTYTLPAVMKRDLRQVWLARNLAPPYEFEQVVHWRLGFTSPGNNVPLTFLYQPRVGVLIRLVYMAPHPPVYADTDAISDYLGLAWPATEVALRLARERLHRSGDDEKRTVQQINDLMARAAKAKALATKGWPKATPKLTYSPW